VTGQYASVQGAILTLFGGRQLLLDCRTPLPDGLYEFVARTPPAATPAERERAVSSMFRSAFGLQVRRGEAEREVYVLAVASDGAGLAPATTRPTAVGSDQPGALRLRSTTIDALLPHLETWLHKPVVNETGLKGQYDIAFKWKMSKREMLPYTMDQQVLALAVEPDLLKERAVSSSKRRQLAAIRGGPSDADFKALAPEDRENVELLRSELAKPDEERCQPEPAAIVAAVRQYLGLSLTPRRRSVPVLIVERANPDR